MYRATDVGRSINATDEAVIALEYRVDGQDEPLPTAEELSLVVVTTPKICGKLVGEPAPSVLDRLLPNGTDVLVIDDDKGKGDEAFMHVIQKGVESPPEDPPRGSINEQLVRSGV